MKRLGALVLFVVLESCNDGLIHPAADRGPTPIAVRASLSSRSMLALGRDPEAYDRTDRLYLRFRAGDDVRYEQEVPFAPSATETVVRVDVPLRGQSEALDADMELRSAGRAVFRGASSATLAAGAATSMNFSLEPVVASVTCGAGVVPFTAYGQTGKVSGAALFATGDTVRGVDVVWSAPANAPVSVTSDGDLAALQDGDADLTCAASGISGTRSVHVFADVNSVQIAPAAATVVVGNSVTYTATLFDSRGNVISAARPLSWSSSSGATATVTTAGVATGITAGSAKITATSGAKSGNADLTVVPPTTAVTTAAINVTGSTALLIGTVNPRGGATQAWFEWGTDSALTAPSTTSPQNVGNGTTDVGISQAIAGLSPATAYYFRIVASNNGGTVKGSILSFTTPRPPSAITGSQDTGITNAYVVRGSANPNGNAAQAWFEYGVNASMSGASATTRQSIGSGFSSVALSATLFGLQPFTTYYFRTVASNIGGSAFGSTASFRTGGPPTLGTTSTSAGCNYVTTVYSSAAPNGLSTQAWIEYGGTSNFSSYSSTAAQSLGAGTGQVPFQATVPISGTVVYVRAVASNAFGTVRSGVLSVLGSLCIG